MKANIHHESNDCLAINEKSIARSKDTMQLIWADFRNALSQEQFDYNDIESALKATFLKQFDDWFHNIGKQEMTFSFYDIFKNMMAGRGTIIMPDEPAETPKYNRFLPIAEHIKADNRFSPAGVEWLYLAIGETETQIQQCAEKECRVKSGQRFGFCNFELEKDYADLKVVDLTIAENMSYDNINDRLRTVYQKEFDRAMKYAQKHGPFLYKHCYRHDGLKQDIAKWMLLMYAKMMSENLFVPIEGKDKKKEYAPFHTLAMYFMKEGFDGIVYSSTVYPKAKNIVLFNKKYANPVGNVLDYIYIP